MSAVDTVSISIESSSKLPQLCGLIIYIKTTGFSEKFMYGAPGQHSSFVFSGASSVYLMTIL